MANHELRKNDLVEVQGDLQNTLLPIKFNGSMLLYQDDDYLIANKPPRIVSNENNSFEGLLSAALKLKGLKAVHRLDKDTSGCLLFAKHKEAFSAMIPLFREGKIKKVYQAIVQGNFPWEKKTVNTPIDRLPSLTEIDLIAKKAHASLLRITITTGRTHQIRKHLTNIGYPIIGEKVYTLPNKGVQPGIFRSVDRQMLHADTLEFISPLSHKNICAKAPLPADFKKTLHSLGIG